MAAINLSDCEMFDETLSSGLKQLRIVTPATADSADTIAITLADFGIKSLLDIKGTVHTTANSVLADEAPTTVVSSGVLTITIGGSRVDDKIRVYTIVGSC